MAIDGEKFLEWCESRFGHCLVKGNEVRINSPFVDPEDPDTHHHCWCRVDGSTKKGEEREFGIYHCFKTDKKGSLPGLVMTVEGCDFQDALEILGADSLRDMDIKLQQFFDDLYGKPKPQPESPPPTPAKMCFPPSTHRIVELASNDRWRVDAEIHLKSRKLPVDKYWVCTAGRYRDRIIIPYWDRAGELIYWNGRYIGKSDRVGRYQGPDYEPWKVGKDDVLYFPEWPPEGATVYLEEGEFDADSIYYSAQSIGEKMYAAAFGSKNLSERQVEMLRPYRLVLGLDADKYGRRALATMCQAMERKGLAPMYVRPPVQWKDWNKMLQETSPKVLVRYVQRNQRPMDVSDLLRLLS